MVRGLILIHSFGAKTKFWRAERELSWKRSSYKKAVVVHKVVYPVQIVRREGGYPKSAFRSQEVTTQRMIAIKVRTIIVVPSNITTRDNNSDTKSLSANAVQSHTSVAQTI